MFTTPIGSVTRFSGRKENQSVSSINNFLPDHQKKKMNGKRYMPSFFLMFSLLLMELILYFYWINIFLHGCIFFQTYPKMALLPPPPPPRSGYKYAYIETNCDRKKGIPLTPFEGQCSTAQGGSTYKMIQFGFNWLCSFRTKWEIMLIYMHVYSPRAGTDNLLDQFFPKP